MSVRPPQLPPQLSRRLWNLRSPFGRLPILPKAVLGQGCSVGREHRTCWATGRQGPRGGATEETQTGGCPGAHVPKLGDQKPMECGSLGTEAHSLGVTRGQGFVRQRGSQKG